ncbi:hypothetical protein L2755_07380 [Shewanella abyssi]|uniref:hypothetical protein n=1 Tax=Shewanella abyssi TaxID=311789 RepID=UPI002010621C|nr:hypothetical protein [Shewanella abyssi]MCL1049444.1 hypothetical protein [Shewanella abyssi]
MKIGKITGNNNIPINNILSRTPIFAPWQKNEISKAITDSQPVIFDNKKYQLQMHGSKLNHSTDYPFMALVIKHWLNNKVRDTGKSSEVVITLDEISQVFNLSFVQNRKSNFSRFEKSLLRLRAAVLSLEHKKEKVCQSSSLIEYSDYRYRDKCFVITIGKVLIELYKATAKQRLISTDFSFIDIEKLVEIKTERSKALMKYLMTQSIDFIDFKLVTLGAAIGLEGRVSKSKVREYLIESFNELMSDGHITLFQLDRKNKPTQVRVIRNVHTRDIDEAKSMIESLPSNFDFFKAY